MSARIDIEGVEYAQRRDALLQEAQELEARLIVLGDELDEIDEKRASIKGQIEQAIADRRDTGERVDADWFRRAQGASRHYGVDRNKLDRQIGRTNRRLREIRAALQRDCFGEAVREVVDDATWDRIVAVTREIQGDLL